MGEAVDVENYLDVDALSDTLREIVLARADAAAQRRGGLNADEVGLFARARERDDAAKRAREPPQRRVRERARRRTQT